MVRTGSPWMERFGTGSRAMPLTQGEPRCASPCRLRCPATSVRVLFRETSQTTEIPNNLSQNGGGGGSRTPVREALPPEDYMLSPFRQRLCPDGKPHVRHG